MFEKACAVWFLFSGTARIDLINGYVDCATFAPANQLSPIPLILPKETVLDELFAFWLPGMIGQWATRRDEQSPGGFLGSFIVGLPQFGLKKVSKGVGINITSSFWVLVTTLSLAP